MSETAARAKGDPEPPPGSGSGSGSGPGHGSAPGQGPGHGSAPATHRAPDEPSRLASDHPDLADRAAALDAADPLAPVRERFVLDDTGDGPAAGESGTPTGTGGRTGGRTVYLDGNSLGALPTTVLPRLTRVVTHEWGELRIRSWEESGWWSAPERIGDRIAPLIGAAPGQVVVGDSTSVNVFKALVAAVRMAPEDRDEILVDDATFPTDGYLAQSAARMTGRSVRPVPAGEIAAAAGSRTAVALVNHVDYRTGRLHDLPGITAALHSAGALAVWDLCHSAGALPVALDADGVDLAVGCTYKYLNGGPGSPAYLYVRRDIQPRFDSPLPGWTSHADPFGMSARYEPAEGATRGRVGTPEILSLLALDAALDVWDGVTVPDVRAKSLALTDFFLDCVAATVPAGLVESVTPVAHAARGSQVSLRCARAGEVMAGLIARGVVGDYRRPDILRFGFTPLYVGYADALHAARVLAEVLKQVTGQGPADADEGTG
jgi:kynureninase